MVQKQSGKLPAEGKIILESVKEEWRLFESGFLSSFSTAGVIEQNNRRLRIKIEVKSIISPSRHSSKTFVIGFNTGVDQEKAGGITRAKQFFANMINERVWLIFGYIKGKNEIPIVIVYYEILDISIYAQKLAEEKMEIFLPTMFNPPSSN